MTPPTNTTPTTSNDLASNDLASNDLAGDDLAGDDLVGDDLVADDLADGYPNEDLHCAVSLVEDWLLHASPETLDELADFAYGPTYRDHDGHDQLRWIIELLGATAARLRPAPPPAAPPATPDPASPDPTTSQRRRG